jgi:phage-related protein
MLIGKGVGNGLRTGDGRAVVSGFTEGVTSVGTGVGQSVESVVTGTAGGVYSVGKGFFSGVKSVGQGIGGAFAGKKAAKKWGSNREK